MSQILTFGVQLTTVSCECGGIYAINERYRREKQESGGTWTCPYCKISWGFVKSKLDKAKEQLAERDRQLVAERSRHDQTQAALRTEEKRTRAYKGQAGRLRTRAANGVCPCCKRTFTNLRRHMASKHSNYAGTEAIP